MPAESVIAGDAKPSQAIRASRGTSMRIALEQLSSGNAQGCVSAGNTGALMGLAKLLVKPLEGIERPALMTAIPNQQRSKTVVLDLGANVECDSTMLVQFAVMGAVMAEEVIGIAQPRVALLNIGEEEIKGTDNIREAAAVLKILRQSTILVTGRKRTAHRQDRRVGLRWLRGQRHPENHGRGGQGVLIAAEIVRRRKQASVVAEIVGPLVAKRVVKRFGHLNPDQYNGACLLGLRSTVVKSHGAANTHAFAVAIEQAVQAVQRQVPERIAARLEAVLPKSD